MAMDDQELLQTLDRLKGTMIAVATGGPRIGAVQAKFGQDYDEVAAELASRQIRNPLPYRDLWEWYGRWSSGDMPSWQSRRHFVNEIFSGLIRSITEKRVHLAPHEPTGWERVDRNVTEVRKALEVADNEEKCQVVGLLCRETHTSLAQAVYVAGRHPSLDGTAIGPADAKRMLEAYIAVVFAGDEHKDFRKFVRSANELANHLTHRRTASFRLAAACTEATTSLVNLIAIMAGLRDP
jgi:hypothetical protein